MPMATVMSEITASPPSSSNVALSSSDTTTQSCCVLEPPVLRQSHSAPPCNEDMQQHMAKLCGDQQLEGEVYLLPSAAYHPSNSSSGFCDTDSASALGFFTTATTCSTFSVSSSRTNSLSNEESFSCPSEAPSSGVSPVPQDRKVGKVILVPDVAAIENNNDGNFHNIKPPKRKGPIDVFLNKLSSLSIS